jgi:hypothetical protein
MLIWLSGWRSDGLRRASTWRRRETSGHVLEASFRSIRVNRVRTPLRGMIPTTKTAWWWSDQHNHTSLFN